MLVFTVFVCVERYESKARVGIISNKHRLLQVCLAYLATEESYSTRGCPKCLFNLSLLHVGARKYVCLFVDLFVLYSNSLFNFNRQDQFQTRFSVFTLSDGELRFTNFLHIRPTCEGPFSRLHIIYKCSYLNDVGRRPRVLPLLQTNAQINPGSSGGKSICALVLKVLSVEAGMAHGEFFPARKYVNSDTILRQLCTACPIMLCLHTDPERSSACTRKQTFCQNYDRIHNFPGFSFCAAMYVL